MIHRRTIIAASDPTTGLSMKRIETSNGDYNSRKLAVNNTMFSAELRRIAFKKPILPSNVQIHHIHYDKRLEKWKYNEQGDDRLDAALLHAEKYRRLFIPYLQFTQELWENLNWEDAETYALQVARRAMPIVPYHIPLFGELKDWELRKKFILQTLNKSQELMPVICLYHEPVKAMEILKKEFRESKLLGTHYFNIKEPYVKANLEAFQQLTFRLPVGAEVPLIIGLCPSHRSIESLGGVSSAYLLSLFGIDIVSYRVLSPEQIYHIDQQLGPEEYKFYDNNEGGYNKSATQLAWYGRELTRETLSRISVDEGLEPYQAHLWADFLNEMTDFDMLNMSILAKKSRTVIMEKSRWHTAAIYMLPKINFE